MDSIFAVELEVLSPAFAQVADVDAVLRQLILVDAVVDSIFVVGLATLFPAFAQPVDVVDAVLRQLTLVDAVVDSIFAVGLATLFPCLLYTSPSPRDATLSRMPSSA